MKPRRTVACLAAAAMLTGCEVSEPPRELDEGATREPEADATDFDVSDDVGPTPGDAG